MFQQLINNYSRSKREKVTDILFDIELFYGYLQQYGQIIEIWYFQNVFTTKYWEYLDYYSWLSPQKQTKLHQGILSLLLFKCYQHLENTAKMDDDVIRDILYSINRFHTSSLTSMRLKSMVKKAISIVLNNSSNYSENELLESITWTLKNIVLTNNIEKQTIN